MVPVSCSYIVGWTRGLRHFGTRRQRRSKEQVPQGALLAHDDHDALRSERPKGPPYSTDTHMGVPGGVRYP